MLYWASWVNWTKPDLGVYTKTSIHCWIGHSVVYTTKHSVAHSIRPNWLSVRQQTSLLSQLFRIEQNVQQSASNVALLIGIHRGAWLCPRYSHLLPALLLSTHVQYMVLISSGVFGKITKGMFCSHPSSSWKENHDFQFLAEELVGNFSLKADVTLWKAISYVF